MNKQSQMVNDVIEVRRWAVKTESTKSGGDYRKLKMLYPNENDYNLVRRLYWHLAFKGRGTWDSYFNSKAPKEHNHQFDVYLLPGVWAPAKGIIKKVIQGKQRNKKITKKKKKNRNLKNNLVVLTANNIVIWLRQPKKAKEK